MVNKNTNFYKPKKLKSNPSPETIRLYIEYAITVNLALVSGQLEQDVELYLKYFNQLSQMGIYYRAYPEFSKTGRLHYHGTIVFRDVSTIAEFYLWLYNKMTRTEQINIHVKEIDDRDGWEQYMTKQTYINKKFFKLKLLRYFLQTKLYPEEEVISEAF